MSANSVIRQIKLYATHVLYVCRAAEAAGCTVQSLMPSVGFHLPQLYMNYNVVQYDVFECIFHPPLLIWPRNYYKVMRNIEKWLGLRMKDQTFWFLPRKQDMKRDQGVVDALPGHNQQWHILI